VLLGSGRGGGDRSADRGEPSYADPLGKEAAPITDDDIPF
jgi:hypothetical protein